MLKGMYLHLFCEGCGKNYGNSVVFPADGEGFIFDTDDLAQLIDDKGWGLYIREDEHECEHLEILCPECAEKRKEK